MTELGDSRNSNGLFRTPLACAMLTGALAVATHETFGFFYSDFDLVANYRLFFVQAIAVALVLLLGAYAYRRDPQTLGVCVTMTPLLSLLEYATEYEQFLRWVPGLYLRNVLVVIILNRVVGKVAYSALLGIMLAILYRTRGLWIKCAMLAVVAVIPYLILWTYIMHRYVGTSLRPTSEVSAFSLLLRYLTTVAMVVLPTVPIDRALRRAEMENGKSKMENGK